MKTSYYAKHHPVTEDFMKAFIELCEEHSLTLVPTYESRISFHDGMRVVPFTNEAHDYVVDAGVIVDDADTPGTVYWEFDD